MAKRLFDTIVSASALVVLSPLLAAIALAVKLDSPGPVLYSQERVGLGFKRFRIRKFRSMIVDADKYGRQFTARGDARVSRIGRLLRRTKLDELPQLWNVLIGDMSFVGPRPEVPSYVELFRDDYETILTVRPGITDLASLKYRNEEALLQQASDPEQEYVTRILPDKIRLAKVYVNGTSPVRDIGIILRTIGKVARA